MLATQRPTFGKDMDKDFEIGKQDIDSNVKNGLYSKVVS